MSKHTLFVCKSCHRSEEELSEHQLRDGTRLLEQIKTLSEEFASSQLEIQPVGCLWACDHGCVAAISSPEKPTYLFTELPLDNTPEALLEFAQHYIQHRKGAVAWKEIPEQLKSFLACVPSVLVPYVEEE